eukprot:188405-Prorocentrum_minimum.AAC.1
MDRSCGTKQTQEARVRRSWLPCGHFGGHFGGCTSGDLGTWGGVHRAISVHGEVYIGRFGYRGRCTSGDLGTWGGGGGRRDNGPHLQVGAQLVHQIQRLHLSPGSAVGRQAGRCQTVRCDKGGGWGAFAGTRPMVRRSDPMV